MATQPKARVRILVMDDEEIILKVSKRMLQSLGYEVALVKTGEETVELYQQGQSEGNPFSLVILDLTLPGGYGGVKVIQDLLKFDPQCKAIVSSGFSNDPAMANYREHGFKGGIVKPYTVEAMREIIHSVLNEV